MRARPLERLAALVAAALLGACRAAPAPPEIRPSSPSSSFEPIPNVELTTQEGRSVRFYDDLVHGNVVVVQFFYVHCEGVCPVSTGRMLELQKTLGERLGRDIRFLSITLEPEVDTPSVLAEHARAIGAGPGWTFLTGRRADIEVLRRRLGVFDIDPVIDADKTQHAGVLVMGNDAKQRWAMKPATLPARALLTTLERVAEPLSDAAGSH